MLDEVVTTQDFTSIDTLSQFLINANISRESLESLLERDNEMKKRNEILARHKSPISQLPNGKWYTRLDGRKIQRTKLKDLEDEVIRHYTSPEYTIRTLFHSFIERRKVEVEGTTWSKDLRYFNQYLDNSDIADIPLKELSIKDGYNFMKHCKEIKPDMTQKYWGNVSSSLNRFFQYAIDEEIMDRNPFEHLKPKRDFFQKNTPTREEDTVFTTFERDRICSLAEFDAKKRAKSESLGIVLSFNLGIRIGELCALKWGDIETTLRGNTIHIQREIISNTDEDGKVKGCKIVDHCKSISSDRVLILNQKAQTTLKLVKKMNEDNGISVNYDDFIFQRRYKGEYTFCTVRSYDSRIRRFCKEADMEVIKSNHDIRRTVCTTLYSEGMPLKLIQQYAGHSSMKQTMEYIRITENEIDTTQFLNKLCGDSSENSNIVKFRKKA